MYSDYRRTDSQEIMQSELSFRDKDSGARHAANCRSACAILPCEAIGEISSECTCIGSLDMQFCGKRSGRLVLQGREGGELRPEEKMQQIFCCVYEHIVM